MARGGGGEGGRRRRRVEGGGIVKGGRVGGGELRVEGHRFNHSAGVRLGAWWDFLVAREAGKRLGPFLSGRGDECRGRR